MGYKCPLAHAQGAGAHKLAFYSESIFCADTYSALGLFTTG